MDFDVIVIGAGPAGSVAAALLVNKGYKVHVIEREIFPRFSIGESLLPQCMELLNEAGLLEVILSTADKHHFQFKNGAAFFRDGQYENFDFRQKFSAGWGTTYQVQRAAFDHELIKEAERKGAYVSWGHEVTSVNINATDVSLGVKDTNGSSHETTAKFLLDASGFGRVLPRLLALDSPSGMPPRTSFFTHVEDGITDPHYDREKILITVHHQHHDVWFWSIPFANGRSSIGVVGSPHYFEDKGKSDDEILKTIINSEPHLKSLFSHAIYDTAVRKISGYSSNVSTLHGNRFALLGNAGEFLDPVFSSGVTIAMKSASLAVAAVDRELQGQKVDWQQDYHAPLMRGVNTFRTFVEAWYDGRFQDVVFAKNHSPEIREMIASILAGYAWDEKNPYVKQSERRLNALAELCQQS